MFKNNFIKYGILVVVVFSLLVTMLVGCGKKEEPVKTEEPEVITTPEPVEDSGKINLPEVSDPEPEPEPEPEVKYSFEDDMVGVKFNYNPEFYSKENTAEVFNTISTIIPEGRERFNIYTDKLEGSLKLLDLTANDDVHITVSIMPFEVSKETTTIKLDGSKKVTNETIETIDIADDELISKYDEIIKKNIESMGCTIVSFEGSKIQMVGKNAEGEPLRAVITNRSYTGPVENTTNAGFAEVYQCNILVGKNAVVISLLSNGEDTEIDKPAVFNEIIESFIVSTAKPVPETETTENAQ